MSLGHLSQIKKTKNKKTEVCRGLFFRNQSLHTLTVPNPNPVPNPNLPNLINSTHVFTWLLFIKLGRVRVRDRVRVRNRQCVERPIMCGATDYGKKRLRRRQSNRN